MAQVRFLDQVPVGVFDPNTNSGGGGQSVNIYYSSSLVLSNVPFINFTGSLNVSTGSVSGSNGVTVSVVGFPYSGSAEITGSLIISGSNGPVLIVYGSSVFSGSVSVSGSITANSFTGSFSGSVAAPGSTTQVVYNSGSVLGADSGFVYSGSRVGIGTSSPTNTFELASTSASPFKVATTETYFRATFQNSGASGLFDFVSNYFSFPTNDVVFGSSNNLGGRVSIKGSGATSATTSFLVQNSSGVEALRIYDTPQVFIKSDWAGSGSVRYPLQVSYGNNANAIQVEEATVQNLNLGNASSNVYSIGVFNASLTGTAKALGLTTNNFRVQGNGQTSFRDDGVNAFVGSSTLLELTSTGRGFLLPRTNLTSNISSPAQGLQTYITASATEGIYYYNSGSYQGWTRVLNSSGSQSITGSLNVTALTASNATITGNVTVLGTASINTLIVNQTEFSSGSNQLGDAADDCQTFYGLVRIPTGSLVVSGSIFQTGSAIQFISNCSVLGGIGNIASGANSVVVAGSSNITCATATGSFVGAGVSNTASGSFSSIGGGCSNIACGTITTIGGGCGNATANTFSTIAGGVANTSKGDSSFVGGGYSNNTSAAQSVIGGGKSNTISNVYASILGGCNNTVSGTYSTLGGGCRNIASGTRSTVVGGQTNIASGGYTFVGGGLSNTGSGDLYAAVVGGLLNTASGRGSFVGSGTSNLSSGWYSAVLGGTGNTASGTYSMAGAGKTNTSSNTYSVAVGGLSNTAAGIRSVVVGGSSNIACLNATGSFIGGGTSNIASGSLSVVVGGTLNCVLGTCSSILGGFSNKILSTAASNTISGGYRNTIGSAASAQNFIGGGADNTISAGYKNVIVGGVNNAANERWSFIGGGCGNTVLTKSSVVGGQSNTANTSQGFVGGGTSNTVTGQEASIVSGILNTVSNTYSFIGAGCGNTVTAACSAILGGIGNRVTAINSFVVGSNLTASLACYTYMNNISVSEVALISSSLYSTKQSGSLVTGSNLIYSVDTGSYTAGFFDYHVTSGSNGRAGTVMSYWLGGQIQYTDNSTPDVGNTSNLAFSMSLSASSAQLFASASSAGWNVKTSFRTF